MVEIRRVNRYGRAREIHKSFNRHDRGVRGLKKHIVLLVFSRQKTVSSVVVVSSYRVKLSSSSTIIRATTHSHCDSIFKHQR